MNRLFWTSPPTAPDDCASLDPLLSLYADGMASPDEARRVEAHLTGCAACRQSLLWTQATRRALSARPIMVPPPDLRARIAEAIAASSAAPVRPVRSFSLRPAFAAAASLSVLGLLSFGLLHAPAPHHTATPQHPVAVATGPRETVPSVAPGPAVQPAGLPRLSHRALPVRHADEQVAAASDEAPTAPVAAPPPVAPGMGHGVAVAPAPKQNDAAPPTFKARLPRLQKRGVPRPNGAMLARRDVKPDTLPTHHGPLPSKMPGVTQPPQVASSHTPTDVILPPVTHDDPVPTVRTASAERHAPGLLDDVNKAIVRMRAAGYVRPKLALTSATISTHRVDSDGSPTFPTIYTP